jgi:hypothetical protein
MPYVNFFPVVVDRRDESHLIQDNWGGRFVRVRGAAKDACHLFFGVLALTADRLIYILP